MSHIWEQVEAETGWMKNFGQAVVDAATRAERKRCIEIVKSFQYYNGFAPPPIVLAIIRALTEEK